LIIIVAFALLWLLLIRPQRKRQLERQRALSEVEVGDEIVSTGGVFGVVKEIGETELHVEIAPGVTVRMARAAVAGYVERDEPQPEQEPEAAPEPTATETQPDTPAEPS
jgi:preprotein translocase subunit YajC